MDPLLSDLKVGEDRPKVPLGTYRITGNQIKEAGLWFEYCQKRDGYRTKGSDATEARNFALEDIYPLMEQFTSMKAQRKSMTLMPDLSPVAGKMNVEDKKPPDESQGQSCEDPEPVVLKARSKTRRAVDSKTRTLASAAPAKVGQKEWSRLGPEFFNRQAGPIEVVMYVAKYLEVPERILKVSEAPSLEAWSMLINYRMNDKRKSDFWDKIYSKLMPSKAQLEKSKGQVSKDGHSITRTIDRILKINKRIGHDQANVSVSAESKNGNTFKSTEPDRPLFPAKVPEPVIDTNPADVFEDLLKDAVKNLPETFDILKEAT